ncbi:hypothetical protein CHUAL_001534 [Chamberlinius hualienensis]
MCRELNYSGRFIYKFVLNYLYKDLHSEYPTCTSDEVMRKQTINLHRTTALNIYKQSKKSRLDGKAKLLPILVFMHT